jgi:hypothetical protein
MKHMLLDRVFVFRALNARLRDRSSLVGMTFEPACVDAQGSGNASIARSSASASDSPRTKSTPA